MRIEKLEKLLKLKVGSLKASTKSNLQLGELRKQRKKTKNTKIRNKAGDAIAECKEIKRMTREYY